MVALFRMWKNKLLLLLSLLFPLVRTSKASRDPGSKDSKLPCPFKAALGAYWSQHIRAVQPSSFQARQRIPAAKEPWDFPQPGLANMQSWAELKLCG